MKGCGLIFLVFVFLGLIFTVFSNDSTFTDINGQPYDARPIALSILLIALAGACIPYLLKIIKQNKQEKNRDNFRDLFFTTLETKDFDSKNKITLRIPKSIGLAVDNNMERIAIFQETVLIIYGKDDILSSNIVHIRKDSGLTGNITTVMTLITNKNNSNLTIKLFFENKDDSEKFNTLINDIIKSKPEKSEELKQQSDDKSINTDKLLQLFEMYKQRLLTEEEFNKQKQILL